ncbi:LLM class F420-dependent oxidoreductase [Streptomyces cellostaticus]|uniref:LLM class F420-dependent oxidoreductase n=1 Tax=Streptomyces cellostaticus TaxID=67285 RepID=A0A101NSU0_9ACTN|nr:LLM class F420-dependent oxidoreductase [Streptomyces cellostaticus]KUM98728.1 LLM class F420-dependent oxidoreductase [Streptomyces cellostaticus]GHI03130.1 LLM class F420-dependent oxidoreductase [Streptomyces cellostaticus]
MNPKLRIYTAAQQGTDYAALLRVARTAEDCGFDAFFTSDHYLKLGDVPGLPGPIDAWITMAGLARETRTIRLGTLMSSATFRLPGPLAIAVAQIDRMSGGRVELGLGTGWYADEHTAYGIPFPSLRERFDRFEEQLAVITGLWDTPEGKTFTYEGTHYRLTDSPALPKPVQQPRPPVLIGGDGPVRTPRLVAAYADEFNVPFLSLEATTPLFERARQACDTAGRDPDTLHLSTAQVLCCGRTRQELRRRAEALGPEGGPFAKSRISGTPSEVVDTIGRFAEAGVSRLYLQPFDLSDLDHLELVAAEVLPQLA